MLLAAGDTFRAAAREQLVSGANATGCRSFPSRAAIRAPWCSTRSARREPAAPTSSSRTPPGASDAAPPHGRDPQGEAGHGEGEGGAPHEVVLVLDANTGQNALAQVKAFDEALGLTGLVITKLDGTAKGGVVCAIAREKPVPLMFVGVGEGIDDLRPFVAREFAEALVG